MVNLSKIKKIKIERFIFSSKAIVLITYLILVITVIANIFYLPFLYGTIEKYSFFMLVFAIIILAIAVIMKDK